MGWLDREGIVMFGFLRVQEAIAKIMLSHNLGFSQAYGHFQFSKYLGRLSSNPTSHDLTPLSILFVYVV